MDEDNQMKIGKRIIRMHGKHVWKCQRKNLFNNKMGKMGKTLMMCLHGIGVKASRYRLESWFIG